MPTVPLCLLAALAAADPAADPPFLHHPAVAVSLAAAEPHVVDPVAARFDEHGTLWVVEMRDYPVPVPGREPDGRVVRLTDRDGDGTFETARPFAAGLMMPTGVQPWRGGAFVTLAGRLSYFPDEDGDGTADGERVWFTGFTTDNEQLRANHPTLAPDGLVYVANGLRDGVIVRGDGHPRGAGGEPVDIGGRDFAFDPHGGTAAAVSGEGQFGLTVTDFGDRFVCMNREPLQHVVLPDALLARNPHLAVRAVMENVAAGGAASHIHAAAGQFTTSLAHAGQFTAACGVTVFAGDGLGPEFTGNAYTCEPTAGVVHREVLTPAGATYTSAPGRDGAEFLASTDPSVRPVNLTGGPDGALYVVDMHRAVIEHPHWMPVELKDRPDLRVGDDTGRLWRVAAAGGAGRTVAESVKPFAGADAPALVALLDHPNDWHRATAARLLLERRDPAAAEPLRELVRGGERAEGRARALFLLAASGVLGGGDVVAGLGDADPRVAGVAAVVHSPMPPLSRDRGERSPRSRLRGDAENRDDAVAMMLRLADTTRDARLRFDLTLGLAPHADRDDVVAALAKLARETDDPWTRTAVLAAAGSDPLRLARAVLEEPGGVPASLVETLGELAVRAGGTGGIAPFLDLVLAADDPDAARAAVVGLNRGTGGRLGERLAAGNFADLRGRLESAVFAPAAKLAARTERPPAERVAAVGVLGVTADSFADLRTLATGDPEAAVRAAAVERLAAADDPHAAAELLPRLNGETPAVREAILDLLASDDTRAALLLDAVEAGEVSAMAVGPARTTRLTTRGDAAVRDRAASLLSARPADRAAVLSDYSDCAERVAAGSGDLAAGRVEFVRVCATCHRVDGVGEAVGPDISDTYNRTPGSLLTDILDPNRAVDGNGQAWTVVLADGRVLSGLLSAETATSLSLTTTGGKAVTVPRGEVLELGTDGSSLMPVGLEKQLTESQMTDLIAFLKGWRYAE